MINRLKKQHVFLCCIIVLTVGSVNAYSKNQLFGGFSADVSTEKYVNPPRESSSTITKPLMLVCEGCMPGGGGGGTGGGSGGGSSGNWNGYGNGYGNYNGSGRGSGRGQGRGYGDGEGSFDFSMKGRSKSNIDADTDWSGNNDWRGNGYGSGNYYGNMDGHGNYDGNYYDNNYNRGWGGGYNPYGNQQQYAPNPYWGGYAPPPAQAAPAPAPAAAAK